MKKRIIAIICVFMLFTQQVYASVLGTEVSSWSHDIATGTKIFNTTFMSNQIGVGQQVEHYAEYIPNESVVPTIVSGDEMWGFDTVSQAENYMRANGMVPLLGINASYYSLQTGIPMGHVISDGKIISKDTESYQSIGFNADGSAFIAPLSIKTTLYYGDKEVDIAHINKYNQTLMDIINLYTPEFADHNHSDAASLDIILGNIHGELGIGKELTAVVEEKFNYQGPIKIPKDKIVLTVNEIAKPELYAAISSLNIGDEVKISSTATGGDMWKTAVSALGSVGETLIIDGQVQNNFSISSAPRTAVGITDSGKVIFYVLDGRQKPYSYGAQVKTLANRMKELGCVDAINLDGGGSSVISGVFPGTDISTVLNSPSDGKPRGVSNYIFLRNTKQPTNILSKLYLYPFSQHYLSGYSETIYPEAVDSEFYSYELPEKLEFLVSGTDSVIDSNGVLTAKGNGVFTIKVTGNGASGEAKYTVYNTPTNIDIYNTKTGKEIKKLTLKQGDRVQLKFEAQYNDISLKSNYNCFDIDFPANLGKIEDNELIITSDGGEGKLVVGAGDYKKEIEVKINRQNPFFDTDFHWAKDMIKKVFENGIVKGVVQDGKQVFMPDNSITREEFAVIICNYLNIDTSEFTQFDLSEFTDKSAISEWAMPYVSAVYKNGIISGKADGDDRLFAPKDSLTRAEIMTILGRIVDNEDNYTELTFADAAEIPEWAAKYVSKMVNHGYVSGYNDNTLRPANIISRAEVATIIYKMLQN